jgi:uncharacterized protein
LPVVGINPFACEKAIANSCALVETDGRVIRFGRNDRPPVQFEHVLFHFRSIIAGKHPCVGAKSAFKRGCYRVGVYNKMCEEESTAGLCYDLYNFIADSADLGNGVNAINGLFTTFVATFIEPKIETEMDFHNQLWNQLQLIHEADRQYHPWDSTVSSDISSPNFAFSFASQALFIVGMNPASSRIARRTPWPAMAFNPHSQFRLMREANTFSAMKLTIRERDFALQGSLNPNLADYGMDSEAKQYSGIAADDNLICPFHAKGKIEVCPPVAPRRHALPT